MERNANYALVGLASMILFVGLVVFVFWLARLQFNQEYDTYDILFTEPVRGLSEGGEVHFNGIKVGDVTKLALDARDPNRVIARVRITSEAPVRVDSRATLEPQGVTGVNYVQITAGTPSKPLLRDTVPPNEVPVILSQRSTISDLLEGGGTVLSRTIEALDRINRVLSDQNIRTFSASLSDVQAVTAELRARKQVIADAQRALQSAEAAANEVTKLAANTNEIVDTDGRRAIKDAADAAAEVKAAAADARSMISKLEGPTSDFATNGLPQLTSTITTLQETSESLQRLIDEINRSPRDALLKPPVKELEVQP
ncbi:MAG TPA: MlaD family protein [Caulobacteraceae bacterium]|nr:MlaD family protein [Caulobacteraceae bacterium]